MTFYDQLVRETEAQREALYAVPTLVAALQGKISKATYVAYLTQAYHHVSHTVPFLMAMGASLPQSKAWMREAIVEYIEEEAGHEQWILNDIKAAGGDAIMAQKSKPSRQTEMLLAYNYDYIARKNPVGFFGMVFMLESTSTQLATHGAGAIKKSLGLPDKAFSYLVSHGALDIKHMEFFKNTVNKITDKADQAAIIEVAQNTFLLFADLLGAVPTYNDEARHAA